MNVHARRHFVALMLVSVSLSACHRKRDDAPPVATVAGSLRSATAPVGKIVDVSYRFTLAADAPPIPEDTLVFVHVVDEHGKGMWTDDHQPPVPIGQWKPGNQIEYARPLFVSRRAYPGRYNIDVGLYSPRTGQRLPLSGTSVGGRAYRVGSFDVTPGGPTPLVAFFSGWQDQESDSGPGTRLGREWHWSTRESVLWCPQPGRDAQFILHVDHPIVGSDVTRAVRVYIGDRLIDEFELVPGAEEVRRVPVAAAFLGTDDIVKIRLTIDKLVVPARIPGNGSGDARALGIRVLDALLEPT